MAEQKIKVYVLVTFYDETGLHKAGSVTEVFESEFNSYYMKKIEGGGGSTVEVDQIVSTGTKIATIKVDSDATDIYAPEGSGGGSEIDNIGTDGSDRVSSMDIDGTGYQFTSISNIWTDGPNAEVSSMDINGSGYTFATGSTTIDNISTDSENKVSSMDINGSSNEFTSVENISTSGPNGVVDSIDINGSSYSFGTGSTTIENISETGGVVDSMDIDGTTYSFGGGAGGGNTLRVLRIISSDVSAVSDIWEISVGDPARSFDVTDGLYDGDPNIAVALYESGSSNQFNLVNYVNGAGYIIAFDSVASTPAIAVFYVSPTSYDSDGNWETVEIERCL